MGDTKDTPVTVFCDSQKALKAVNRPSSWKESRFMRGMIYLTTKKLDENGNRIAVYWVPGLLETKKPTYMVAER